MFSARVTFKVLLVACVLVLSGCGLALKDLDVTLPDVPPTPVSGEASALEDGDAMDEDVMQDGDVAASGNPGDAPPEDLAMLDFPGQPGGADLDGMAGSLSFDAPRHASTLGPTDLADGYGEILVDPSDRMSFTSGGWEPGAIVSALYRPGHVVLGNFVASENGTVDGVIQIPADVPLGAARLQFVGRSGGMRTTDTIHVQTGTTTEALEATCDSLRRIEELNAQIVTVLNGDDVDFASDPGEWWPALQTRVAEVTPTIDLLRAEFNTATSVAPSALVPAISGADADDAFLLDGLMSAYESSSDAETFSANLDAYRNDSEVQRVENEHRIFEVEAFTIASCGGLTLDSFHS